ncbi:uncharacterized protein BJ171DRAFT_598468 [Polychytrium aggregatum]|uniref:uncharacterized protein n=1 Tax=Polychytrium aggregatum TaxID=110093 RepID=UPI0022FDD0F7|nr:uncharacterized protein BJ171DRAFT_598468 [Polychytrium aggregatum]KAI9205355.1 hypothetical protein BJ171DRAFT_598468 [Polychytrium aggregatum]
MGTDSPKVKDSKQKEASNSKINSGKSGLSITSGLGAVPGGGDSLSKSNVALEKTKGTFRGTSAALKRKEPIHLQYWHLVEHKYKIWKGGFFAMLCALLVESHNATVSYLTMFIEFLQTLAFSFDNINWGVWGSYMGMVLKFFQIETALTFYLGTPALYVLVILSLILIIIMLSLTVYVVKSFVSKNFQAGVWPLRALRSLVGMLSSVFYLPVLYSMMSIFVCGDGATPAQCAAIERLILKIVSGIVLPIFVSFTLLMSLTYFNPNPLSTCVVARPSARLEFVELTTKTILACSFVFAESVPLLRACMTCLCSILICVFMLVFIPYYHKPINNYRFILSSQALWGSFGSIIVTALGQAQQTTFLNWVFIFYIIGIVPWGVGCYFFFNWRQQKATSINIAKLCFQPSRETFNTWEAEPVTAKESRFWHPSQVEIATRFLIEDRSVESIDVADQMFIKGTQLFPTSASLMVSYAIFYSSYRPNDRSMSAHYLKKAGQCNPLIDLEFMIYHLEQERRQTMNKVGDRILDAVDRVEFNQLMRKALTYHCEAKSHIANFWQAIMASGGDSKVDANTLISLVSIIEWSDRNATTAYKQLLNRFPDSVRVLSNYAKFLDEIHNNLTEADLILARIDEIREAGGSDDAGAVGLEKRQRRSSNTSYSKNDKSKKQRKAFKEYRRQVFLYSKALSARLMWMIRGVVLLLIGLAGAQMVIVLVEVSYLFSYIDDAQTINSMRMEVENIYNEVVALAASGMQNDVNGFQGHQQNLVIMGNVLYSSIIDITSKLQPGYITYQQWTAPLVMIIRYSGALSIQSPKIDSYTLLDTCLDFVQSLGNILNMVPSDFQRSITFSNATTNVTLRFFEDNHDWRFVCDNGPTILVDSLTSLSAVYVERYTGYIMLFGYVQIAIYTSTLIILILIGRFLFESAINRAKHERVTSLTAFLQIPKSVCMNVLKKYYVPPPSHSKDELAEVDEEQEVEDESNPDSGNAQGGDDSKRSVDAVHSTSTMGYDKLKQMYFHGLSLAAVAFTLALILNFRCSLVAYPFNGIITACGLAQALVGRIAIAASIPMQAGWSGTGIWTSPSGLMSQDTPALSYTQAALLYGNDSMWIPPRSYAPGTDSWLSQPIGSFGTDLPTTIRNYLDYAHAYTDGYQHGSFNASAQWILQMSPAIIQRYGNISDVNMAYSISTIQFLSDASIIAFTAIILVTFGIYMWYFRKILFYLINTENERTLKLLLMIPMEAVNEIASLRDLLHLKKTFALPAKAAEAPQPIDRRQSTRDDGHHHTVGHDADIGSADGNPTGYARSRREHSRGSATLEGQSVPGRRREHSVPHDIKSPSTGQRESSFTARRDFGADRVASFGRVGPNIEQRDDLQLNPAFVAENEIRESDRT